MDLIYHKNLQKVLDLIVTTKMQWERLNKFAIIDVISSIARNHNMEQIKKKMVHEQGGEYIYLTW